MTIPTNAKSTAVTGRGRAPLGPAGVRSLLLALSILGCAALSCSDNTRVDPQSRSAAPGAAAPSAQPASAQAPTPPAPAQPPSHSARFQKWIDALKAAGYFVRENRKKPDVTVQCTTGAKITAFQENPKLVPPASVCSAPLSTANQSQVSRVLELRFASPADAEAALPVLLKRGDGTDPDVTFDKSLVSGWVEGATIYWVGTRALEFEEEGCRVIALFGGARPQGMHNPCGSGGGGRRD